METGFTKWIIVITVVMCCLLELIDTSIVNVALTQMMGNLSATQQEVSWVVASYAIANVIVIPMTGFLAEQFGRKNYYLFSVILFTVASMACGQSTNIWELVAFRFIQGIGGGALMATSQAILIDTFPPQQLALGQALFGMGVIIGPTIGPTLGGYIVDNYDWPWIFYVNVPVGVMAAIFTVLFIRDPERIRNAVPRPLREIDWAGIVLLIVGVGSLQYVLEQGESKDWFEDQNILLFTALTVIGLVGFIWRELTARQPIVDLRVLGKSRNLAVGSFLSFILGFGLFASVFVFPIFCQRILGFSAAQTGYILLPGALLSGFMMPVVGKSIQAGVSQKFILPIGFIVFFIFSYWMSTQISPTAGESDFFWPLLLRGFGLALLFLPITTMSLAGLSGKDAGQAAGLTGMIRQLGGSFGVALVGTYLERTTMQNRIGLLPNISLYDPETQQRLQGLIAGFMAKGASVLQAQQQAYAALEGMVMKQTALITYAQTFLMIGTFFLLCVPLIFLIKRARPGEKVDLNAAH
ncbi:DHA2 family efflux MFS transporter permease subunit [Hymenobacter lutimineralis]|uniref:DHA2 family efflux MFS transporter permease subunit n=1 Tax=Hymenobacter lutimineralis TaxID=2606448 RepID=A0A5D6UZL8_9BACT|nr:MULTISPECIES: DHA2 family efflux MFS transporter permease subunit [Hymenobacter]QIX61727.1 DHA2 family efflux MFS transporter permease subunit [Hymenobacter sp. BT18]TYZ09271.1 DHA2 family efflux MFS transporter permease subunit [Hymenobacter lutimineralis]